MKTFLTCAVAAAIAVAPLAAGARDRGAEHRDPGAIFEMFDTNGDGEVTRTEIEERAEARFDAADTNGDGTISEAEFVAAAADRARERAAEAFARLDVDGDGSLSRDVMSMRKGGSARIDRVFSRIDANGDDTVTRAEFDAAAERFGERRGRHRN